MALYTRHLDGRVPQKVPAHSLVGTIPAAVTPFIALFADLRIHPFPASDGFTCPTGMGSTNLDGGESSDGSCEDD